MNIQICPRLTRDNPLPLEHRDAAMRPSTFRDGTVEAVIATSSDVRRRDQRGEFIERLDVRGADLTAFRGASVLDAHRQSDGVAAVLGVVDDVGVEGDALVARSARRIRAKRDTCPRSRRGCPA
jgi:hypothetical protein